jgi:hypothetical protein
VNRGLFSLRAGAATLILALALGVLPRGGSASGEVESVQIDKIVALFAIDRVGRNPDGTARESSTLYRFDSITRVTPADRRDRLARRQPQLAPVRAHKWPAPGRGSRASKMFQAS